jgi:CRISPR-associated protein Csd1
VLEKLQIEAIKPNRTIRDQFYGAASTTPAAVMATLIRKSTPHITKLEARGRHLDSLLGPILAPVDRFPTTMGLVDQGLFALGYYHQRETFYTKPTETTEPETNPASETTTPDTTTGAVS